MINKLSTKVKTMENYQLSKTFKKFDFTSSKDSDEKRLIHCESNNKEIMIGVETKEIIAKLFTLLLQRYQGGLGQSIKGSSFVTDCVDGMFYSCHKISLNCGGSDTDFPG